MKVLHIIIFGLTCFFSASAQENANPATVLNTIPQSKENTEVKQDVSVISQAATNPSDKTDIIALKESEFDFGKIPQGKPTTHDFFFTNTGSAPVSLQNVQASCGCTTPEWSKDAVAPGATAKITVGYNAASLGTFTKSITITYNDNQSKELIIKGEVWETPKTSAPENTALQTLNSQQ